LAFDQAHGTSDGGAMLLSAANRRFGNGLIESLSLGDRLKTGHLWSVQNRPLWMA